MEITVGNQQKFGDGVGQGLQQFNSGFALGLGGGSVE